MLAYYFRLLGEDGSPNGYVGLAIAANMRDMFWQIDEFCDPYMVEIKTAHMGGFCYHQDIQPINGEADVEASKYESSEHTPLADEEGWRKPKWPDPEYLMSA